MRKKKVVIHSNHSKAKTGFGRHVRELMIYLQKTGKYELIEYCQGYKFNDPILQTMPWKTYGVLPDSEAELRAALNNIQPHERPLVQREIAYGSMNIDKLIKLEKPDVYIGSEDVWAFKGYTQRKWWNQITCALHTTLDSLPILPDAVEMAPDVKNYFVWASFAENAMHELGHTHVKTVHGIVNDKTFFRFSDQQKLALRKHHGIPPDAFVIGFVFRNQLRKSVYALLEGFKMFQNQNPQANVYLLLHTNWIDNVKDEGGGGWNIVNLIKEFGIDPKRVLTTYVCSSCGNYEVKPYQLQEDEWKKLKPNIFKGQRVPCKFCGAQETKETIKGSPVSQVTCGTNVGVTEQQLNQIYNLMDVYCHPFTSGGQEMPIQESKLTETITLTTNYSCGIDWCNEESGGLPLDYSIYKERGSNFDKASTYPSGICKNLKKVFEMKSQKRAEIGKRARQHVIDKCSPESVGKFFENFIDSSPYHDWDFNFEEKPKDENYPLKDIEDDKEWLIDLYNNCLNLYPKDDDSGLAYWMNELSNNVRTREQIHDFFIGQAKADNQKSKKIEFEQLFEDNGKKRILFVIKQSIGDCYICTALFASIKHQYPDHDLYIGCKPEYFEVFSGNPYVKKCIPYHEAMENELIMIGQGDNKKYVDIYMNPAIGSQRQLNYLSNEKIGKISIDDY